MDRLIFAINVKMFGLLLFLWYNMKTKHHACSWNGKKKIKGVLSFAQGTQTMFTLPFDSWFWLRLPSCPYCMDTAFTEVQTWGNLRVHHVQICSVNEPRTPNTICPISLCCLIGWCVQQQADLPPPPSAVAPEDTVSLHEQLLLRLEINISLASFKAGSMFHQAISVLPSTNSAVWSWVIDSSRVWTTLFAQLQTMSSNNA